MILDVYELEVSDIELIDVLFVALIFIANVCAGIVPDNDNTVLLPTLPPPSKCNKKIPRILLFPFPAPIQRSVSVLPDEGDLGDFKPAPAVFGKRGAKQA